MFVSVSIIRVYSSPTRSPILGSFADEAGGVRDLLPSSERAEPAEEHGIGPELAHVGAEPALGRQGGEHQLGEEVVGGGELEGDSHGRPRSARC